MRRHSLEADMQKQRSEYKPRMSYKFNENGEEMESLLTKSSDDNVEATSVSTGNLNDDSDVELTSVKVDPTSRPEHVSYQNTGYGTIADVPTSDSVLTTDKGTPCASIKSMGSEAKKRLYWMDNAKLWFMYNVLVGHGVQFIYPLVFKNKLTYLEGLHDFFTWQDVHMHCFMFISGTFASEKLTQDILVKNFVLLILSPFVFLIYWSWFAERNLSEWMSADGLQHGLFIGDTMFQSTWPWFLKTLFMLKVSLWVFGKLPTGMLFLIVSAAHAIYNLNFKWEVEKWDDTTVMYMVGKFCWMFYMGYFCNRHKLVWPAAQYLREHW
eukprot:CAMPEP_0198214158 /NCGR_PEP_ID=MMETSP1445-20131203/38365_1 /TAXON_ID=36898 /ORGANISM="Pyramimonas sp., Strain CCMP2087" /LENGTH=323 /DNA_ID=CAMNT_0043889203 /DNA_START=524 /DNA_END=1492 /DNA_ORIENTATION=-